MLSAPMWEGSPPRPPPPWLHRPPGPSVRNVNQTRPHPQTRFNGKIVSLIVRVKTTVQRSLCCTDTQKRAVRQDNAILDYTCQPTLPSAPAVSLLAEDAAIHGGAQQGWVQQDGSVCSCGSWAGWGLCHHRVIELQNDRTGVIQIGKDLRGQVQPSSDPTSLSSSLPLCQLGLGHTGMSQCCGRLSQHLLLPKALGSTCQLTGGGLR